MGLKVIGAGVGRTGTYSLKLALEQLGFGPCHHMEEVIRTAERQVPLWISAVKGDPDWHSAYEGYSAAVDWPTAAFWRELAAAYPQAKFVLTTRDAERWYESFAATIYALLGSRDAVPPEMRTFLEMGAGVVGRTGFEVGNGKDGIIAAFNAHNDAVKRALPAERLLVYEVGEGWEPLCRFLDRPIPAVPFPKTNGRTEFWERLSSAAP